MLRNRLIYLAALVGGSVFYLFFYAWFSWFLLVILWSLPVLSLVASLPAMLTMELSVVPPGNPCRGEQAELRLQTVCRLPQPRCRFRIRVTQGSSGQETICRARPRSLQMALPLPTGHCGVVTCRVERARVYDYLGLFGLPRRWMGQTETLVLPRPDPPERLPNLAQLQVLSYHAKPGGGYAEVHELRGYRPGDSLREVHWKLTAKVDHPIVREPQTPNRGPVILTLDLPGDPGALDSCLDQTCWLARWLLDHGITHVVRWLEESGPQFYEVGQVEDLPDLAGRLCRSGPTPAGLTSRTLAADACWHYHVLPREEGPS